MTGGRPARRQATLSMRSPRSPRQARAGGERTAGAPGERGLPGVRRPMRRSSRDGNSAARRWRDGAPPLLVARLGASDGALQDNFGGLYDRGGRWARGSRQGPAVSRAHARRERWFDRFLEREIRCGEAGSKSERREPCWANRSVRRLAR